MRNDTCVSGSPGSAGSFRDKVLLLLTILWCALSASAAAQTCNSPPVAADDEAFHEGELMLIDVLANDHEPDGEALAVTSVTSDCGGTLSHDLGLISLLPPAAVSQDCTIDYDVEDEQGNPASATVFVRFTGLVFEDGFESGDTSAWGGS